MRPLGWRILLEIILGAVVITALLVILRQARRLAEDQRRQEADAQALRLLRQALGAKGSQVPAPNAAEQEPLETEQAALAKREATIERLDHDLAEAQARITALQAQLSSANNQNAQIQSNAQAAAQKQQTDFQAQLADLQQKVAAATEQADIARQRAAALEADNLKLHAEGEAVNSQGANVAQTIASLQDLERRRDAYLSSILRRYRDITSDFRAMTGMMDSSHDPNREPNGGPCSSLALGRIQNAVNSAEDDLRQINELDNRSQKLIKQLPKK